MKRQKEAEEKHKKPKCSDIFRRPIGCILNLCLDTDISRWKKTNRSKRKIQKITISPPTIMPKRCSREPNSFHLEREWMSLPNFRIRARKESSCVNLVMDQSSFLLEAESKNGLRCRESWRRSNRLRCFRFSLFRAPTAPTNVTTISIYQSFVEYKLYFMIR